VKDKISGKSVIFKIPVVKENVHAVNIVWDVLRLFYPNKLTKDVMMHARCGSNVVHIDEVTISGVTDIDVMTR